MRSSRRKNSLNNERKIAFRVATRKVIDLMKENKLEEAQTAFIDAQKAIDKAAKNGIIKKNTAARKKSRLHRILRKK